MRRILLSPLAWLALVHTAPAAAQQASNDVVVVGRRDEAARADAVRALTRAISRRTGGQLARFTDPVCPASVDLPPELNRAIVARITAVAREARIPVAGSGCRPNLTVIAVDSGQRTLQALYRVRPRLFTAISPDERKRLLADAGPVHVVTFTELRGRDGTRVGGGNPTSAGGSFAELPTLLVHNASILNPVTRQDIGGALILLDRGALIGRSIRQIADYAAMRTLARTASEVDGDSILTLFAPDATPPAQLTAFDRAYLAGLYHGPATRGAQTQMTDIARGAIASGAEARPVR